MKQNKEFGLYKVLTLALSLAVIGMVSHALAYEKQSSQQKMVTVEVKPLRLAPEQTAEFEISMSTHSVELDDDLADVSILLDDQGRELQPVKWKGSPPGGHHRAGVLFFPALKTDVRSVKLIVRGVAGVPERNFEWKIER